MKIKLGAVGMPADMPAEFDFDAGLTMPNQLAPDLFFGIPAMPNGCTGETQTDICVDEDGMMYNPKFVYDNTRFMEGTQDQDVGCDIRNSLKALSIYGVQAKGETKEQAYTRRRGPYMNLLENRGSLSLFNAVRVGMWRNYKLTGVKRSASMVTPWFREWDIMHIQSDGRMTGEFAYDGNPFNYPWHNWKVAGFVTRNGKLCAKCKTWQGNTYGDHGWTYLEEQDFNKVFSIQFTGAFLPGVALDKKDAAAVGNVLQVMIEQVIVYLRRQLNILLGV